MPLNPHNPLLRLAREVASQPARWEAACRKIASRDFTAALRRLGGIDAVLQSLRARDQLAEPPVGFVAAALAVRNGGCSDFALVLEVLCHPIATRSGPPDVRLLPILIEICEGLGDDIPGWANPYERVFFYMKLGSAYAQSPQSQRVRNQERASACFERALQSCPRGERLLDWAKLQIAAGNVHKERLAGDWNDNQRKALECYELAWSALEEAWAAGQVEEVVYRDLHGDVANNLGNLYRDFHPNSEPTAGNDLSAAIDYFETSLADRVNTPYKQAETLRNLGTTYLAMGESLESVERAIECFEQALEIYELHVLVRDAAMTKLNLGVAYSGEAAAAIAGSRETARQYLAAAQEDYERWCESLPQGQRSCRELVSVYCTRGALELNENNAREAYSYFRRAADLVEEGHEQRVEELHPSAWLQLFSTAYEGCIASLARLSHWEPGLDQSASSPAASDPAARAAAWAEKARARNLSAWIGSRPGKAASIGPAIDARPGASDEPMPTEKMKCLAEETGAALLTVRLTAWGTCAILVTPERNCILRLFDELMPGNFTRLLWQWYRDYTCIVRRLQKMDPSDAVIVRSTELSTWKRTVNQVLGRLGKGFGRSLLEWVGQHYPAAASAKDGRPLIVLPGQGFNLLPLQAMWWEEGERIVYADNGYAFSYAPSCRVLEHCRQNLASRGDDSERLLAIRNPTGDLRLFEGLCDRVAKMFHEKQGLGRHGDPSLTPATIDRLAGGLTAPGALTECDFALFATHGLSAPAHPWEKSFLSVASASDGGEPDRLTLDRICRLDLSRVQCAVLAACETSIPDPTDSSGEQIGFPAAFVAAGASAAIGSLWEVEVGPTALLIHRVFAELRGDVPPSCRSQTLHRAQNWLRTAGRDELNEALLNLDPRSPLIPPEHGPIPYQHPYHWAAFGWHGAI